MLRRIFLLTLLMLPAAQIAGASTETAFLRIQEGTAALLRGQFEQAIAALDRALAEGDLSKTRTANIYSDRGVAKWRLQRYEEALEDFTKSIELDGASAATFNNRANVHIDLGRYEEAIRDLDRAIALAPGYGAAYNNRGNAYFQLGSYQQALKDYQQAVQLLPANAVPYNGRAQVQELLGRPYSGLRYVTRAISLNGKYTAAYRNRAVLYQRLERHSDALADYERLIELAPDDADLHAGRGQVQLNENKVRNAIRDFTKAIELDPENMQAYFGRGSAQLAQKNYEEALADLDQAITLDDSFADAFVKRAEVHFELEDFGRAGADLAKALEILPGNAEAYMLQGRLFEAGEDPQSAIAAYRKALEHDPFVKGAEETLLRLGSDEPPPRRTVGVPIEGWEILNPAPGRYVASNQEFPEIKVFLEMHGEGEPEILEWTLLSESLRGFGLLRYSAGRLPDAFAETTRYEFIAIIDVRKNLVVSIEPFITGESEAKWAWTQTGVTVTDAEGVISAHELRAAPKPRPQVQPQERPWYEDDGRRYRRQPRGLFDWLFN